MASTQNLTKLPTIQYTGMDYASVINEIQNIINNNKNWKENWTQFYSSEAGTMLVQLMAWICDNLAVRQDLIYNENFLTTASTNSAKLRMLKQIGYFVKGTNGAKTKITVELEQPTAESIYLSNYNKENPNDIKSIRNNIFRFKAPDINGKEVSWEILSIDENENIKYTEPVILTGNSTFYTKYFRGDSESSLFALQGETKYSEFYSAESEDVFFNLGVKTIDDESLVVYDLGSGNDNDEIKNGIQHKKVNSFQEVSVMSVKENSEYYNVPCYILERNNDGYLIIRYPGKELMNNSNVIKNHGFKSGHTIGVFYRTSKGTDGNITAEYFNVKGSVKTESGKTIDIRIKNSLAAYGGSDEENIESAIENAPLDLRSNSRAVTVEDFDRILQKNQMVSNSMSYAPENEPEYFEDYYGRKIYPHEVFSFISSNKNYTNIPANRLNYFPWVDTVKESVLNEFYNFFDCKVNQLYESSKNVYGGLLNKTFNNLNDPNDNGNFMEAFKFKNKTGESLKNFTIYKTSNVLGSRINAERFDNEEKKMKVKVHLVPFNGQYITDITNEMFDSIEENEWTFTTDNNIVYEKEGYSATFTSKYINFEKPLNVLDYSEMQIIIDDNIILNVDLKSELDLPTFMQYYGYSVSDNSSVGKYYLKLTNDTKFNQHHNFREQIPLPVMSEKNAIDYYSGEEIANYRLGIVEHFRNALESFLKNDEYEELTQTLALKKEDKIYSIKYEDTTVDYYCDGNFNYKVINYDENTKKYFKEQKINGFVSDKTLQAARAKNEIAYVDLGLQFPESTTAPNVHLRGYDIASYPFFREIVNEDEDFYLYRIKIGEEIYAFRIDTYSITKASEFYKRFRTADVNGQETFFDIFKYIGKGPTFDTSIDFLEKTKNQIENICFNKADPDSYYNKQYSKFVEELKVLGVAETAIPNLAQEKADKAATEQVEEVLAEYLKTYKPIENVASCQELSEYTTYLKECIHEHEGGDKFLWLTVDRLAILLEYIFSPYNLDTGILFKYHNGAWEDIREFGGSLSNVLDGRLRISCISRPHYSYNSSCTKYVFEDEDYFKMEKKLDSSTDETTIFYYDGNEYDIRFDYILPGEDNLTISSVSEEEIELNNEDISEDFLQALFGVRKQYASTKSYLNDLKPSEVFGFNTVKDGTTRFVIKSPKTGLNSSICFIGRGTERESAVSKMLGGKVDVFSKGEENIWRTGKSFGIRKLELYVDEREEADLFKFIKDEDGKISESSIQTINNGDLIFTDNDLNFYNTPSSIYISYKLNEVDRLLIGKRDNFIYTDSEGDEITYEDYCIKQNIEPFVSIDGGISYKDDDRNVKIDTVSSDFAISLTRNSYDNINNFYAIKENSLKTINSAKSNNVSIKTIDFNGINFGNGATTKTFPLRMTIDAKDLYDYERGYDPYYDVHINLEKAENLNSVSLYNKIQDELQNKEEIYYYSDLKYTQNLSSKRRTICRFEKDDEKKLVISNLNRNGGGIAFKYPDEKDMETYLENNIGFVLYFYLSLFGTNKTNPNLYKLYPRESMDPKVVHTLNDENAPQEGGDPNAEIDWENIEYFYAPSKKHNLVFKYRVMEEEDIFGNASSRFADYYIEAEEAMPYKSSNNDKTIYNFYLCKTETSRFPDVGFYLHYMHDRTILIDDCLEEQIVQKYMNKYMIAGTDLNILKPCFKTFDIAAKVYFNANFEENVIKNNLENALKEKYQINNVKNIVIGNKIYLSDITYMMMQIDGVEHVEITYFGFDNSDKENNPTQTKYLSSGVDDFYTMVVLANTTTTHGLQISYEKNQE